MREIKFRAFNTKTKEMLQDVGLMPNRKDFCVSIGSDGIYVNPANSAERVLMQFSGLRDKNGNEIYEGDILRDTEEPAHFQVKWVEDFAGFDFYRIEDGDYMSNFYDVKDLAVTSKVIGNIYEHPELLKETAQTGQA